MVFNTYHHTRTCLDEKIEIDEKNFNFFSLPISLRVILKLSLRSHFQQKNIFSFFVKNSVLTLKNCQTTIPNLKKHLKFDTETRSYDILTKTHQKIPIIPNMAKVWTTLENGMNRDISELYIRIVCLNQL